MESFEQLWDKYVDEDENYTVKQQVEMSYALLLQNGLIDENNKFVHLYVEEQDATCLNNENPIHIEEQGWYQLSLNHIKYIINGEYVEFNLNFKEIYLSIESPKLECKISGIYIIVSIDSKKDQRLRKLLQFENEEDQYEIGEFELNFY